MRFDPIQLEALIGGLNTLDIPRLNIKDSESAKSFLLAYGFDFDRPEDLEKLWSYHRRAVTYVQTEILRSGEQIPPLIADPEALQDISKLLIFASTQGHNLQTWSCGILKVMHAFCHLDNDLFTAYSNEIQEQILKPIQASIHDDPVMGTYLGSAQGENSIGIRKFEVKNFKATNSAITKLLAKPELVAFSLMDKIGIRFVTRHLFDVFRVMRYLIEENIICFAHNIPEQSNNTLYPLNLFSEVMESVGGRDLSSEVIDKLLIEKLEAEKSRAHYKEKRGRYTDANYKFVKFITRRLIRIKESNLGFFYPFEVQIMDYDTYIKNTTGEANHDKYKERQIEEVRARIFSLKEVEAQKHA